MCVCVGGGGGGDGRGGGGRSHSVYCMPAGQNFKNNIETGPETQKVEKHCSRLCSAMAPASMKKLL